MHSSSSPSGRHSAARISAASNRCSARRSFSMAAISTTRRWSRKRVSPTTASAAGVAWQAVIMADLEDRVTELEVRLAFVDDTVNELSSADAEIARRLDLLERAVRDLRSDLVNMRAGIGSDPASEPPPPHYWSIRTRLTDHGRVPARSVVEGRPREGNQRGETQVHAATPAGCQHLDQRAALRR